MTDSITDAYRETVPVFVEWKDQAAETIKWLNSQIETCKLHRKNVNISNLVGSGFGFVGGALVLVGTILIPFSFGASIPLIIAGTAIATSGAAVTVGSSVTEAVLTKGITEGETTRDLGEINERLNRMLIALQSSMTDQQLLNVFPASSITSIHEIVSGISLLRSLGLVAGFADDIVKAVFAGSVAAARTLGIVVGSVAGGLGVLFDSANIGLTIHNMAIKKNSTKKSKQMESVVQLIMCKRRLVERILERLEMELFPGRFCLTCETRIDEETDHICCANEHNICDLCFHTYCTVRLSEEQIDFPCPTGGCEILFDRKTIEMHMPAEFIMKLDKEIYRRAISEAKDEIDLLIWCRFCGSPYQLQCCRDANDTLFFCKNPECNLSFCVNPDCDVPVSRHKSLTCEEAQELEDPDERIRNQLEEKITEITVRTCSNPRCLKKVIKQEGCNLVHCNCGVAMCYLCRATSIDYNHFHQRHGSACPPGCKRCFLDTDPDILDEALIMQVFDEAVQNGVSENIINCLRNRLTEDRLTSL